MSGEGVIERELAYVYKDDLARLRRTEAAAREVERGLAAILAAYEKTGLDHDVAYEDFAEVVRWVRYDRWIVERDARAEKAPS